MNEQPYVYPVLGCPLLRYRALHRDGQWLVVLCIRRADGWRQDLSSQTPCADEASARATAATAAGMPAPQEAAKPAPAPVADLIRRYEAGETPDQIGASLGVSGAAVRKRLIKAGMAMRGHVASHAKYRIPVAERKPRASRARTTEREATPKEIAEREREVPQWMRPAASPSASPAWAAADDALLIEMRRAGEAWGPIARLLGKTADECRDRWYEAGRKERAA